MKLFNDWRILILLCLTLGLAPYTPEPHLVGKIRWLAGGAIGMQPLDYFDLVLHASPFLLLLWLIMKSLFFKKKKHP
jgi:hypothetical protein